MNINTRRGQIDADLEETAENILKMLPKPQTKKQGPKSSATESPEKAEVKGALTNFFKQRLQQVDASSVVPTAPEQDRAQPRDTSPNPTNDSTPRPPEAFLEDIESPGLQKDLPRESGEVIDNNNKDNQASSKTVAEQKENGEVIDNNNNNKDDKASSETVVKDVALPRPALLAQIIGANNLNNLRKTETPAKSAVKPPNQKGIFNTTNNALKKFEFLQRDKDKEGDKDKGGDKDNEDNDWEDGDDTNKVVSGNKPQSPTAGSLQNQPQVVEVQNNNNTSPEPKAVVDAPTPPPPPPPPARNQQAAPVPKASSLEERKSEAITAIKEEYKKAIEEAAKGPQDREYLNKLEEWEKNTAQQLQGANNETKLKEIVNISYDTLDEMEYTQAKLVAEAEAVAATTPVVETQAIVATTPESGRQEVVAPQLPTQFKALLDQIQKGKALRSTSPATPVSPAMTQLSEVPPQVVVETLEPETQLQTESHLDLPTQVSSPDSNDFYKEKITNFCKEKIKTKYDEAIKDQNDEAYKDKLKEWKENAEKGIEETWANGDLKKIVDGAYTALDKMKNTHLAKLGATPKNPKEEVKKSAPTLKSRFMNLARGVGLPPLLNKYPLLNEYVDGNNGQNIMNNMTKETKNGIENAILEIKKNGYVPPKFSEFDSNRDKEDNNNNKMKVVGEQYLARLKEIQGLLPQPNKAPTNPKVTTQSKAHRNRTEQALRSLQQYMQNNVKTVGTLVKEGATKLGKWFKNNMPGTNNKPGGRS